MMFPVNLVHIPVGFEVPVFCWHISLGYPFHQNFCFPTIGNQVRHCNHFHSMRFSKLLQLRCTHHRSILPHNLATEATLFQPSNSHQVHRGLRVSHTLQHAPLLCLQREHMSRTTEIFRFRIILYRFHRGHGTLQRRNSRGRVHVID